MTSNQYTLTPSGICFLTAFQLVKYLITASSICQKYRFETTFLQQQNIWAFSLKIIFCVLLHVLISIYYVTFCYSAVNQLQKIKCVKSLKKVSSRESPKKGLIMDFNLTEKTFFSLIYDKKIQLNSKKAPDSQQNKKCKFTNTVDVLHANIKKNVLVLTLITSSLSLLSSLSKNFFCQKSF